MARRWIYRECDADASDRLARGLGVSRVAARLLVLRGVTTSDGARAFLAPELKHLHDPFLFREMARASERLALAVQRREPILVYGDYDVDGITGTALLVSLLEALGATVSGFVPERKDGYGMRADRVLEAARDGVKVIVAVDNGTTAFAAAEAAQASGIDLVIADHHLGDEPEAPKGDRPSAPHEMKRPPCFALLNPNVPGETYPWKGLCGAGVAFKLAWAVAQSASPSKRASTEVRAILLDMLSLVAVGTIADVVPLEDENRAIVRFGLRSLEASERPGLRALVEQCGASGPLREDDIAFRIGPRINAAGRMGNAKLGLSLLAERSLERAHGLARELDAANRRRQGIEKEILAAAIARAEAALEEAQGRVIVLADAAWSIGVLGIVASRLVERFYRPAVLIALEGGRGKGSARSVPGISLPEAFGRCREHLVRFGGHAAAAGLEIEEDRVAPFRRALGAVLAERPASEDATAPLEIDATLTLPEVSRALVSELDGLSPFGRGNAAPLFAARGVALVGSPRVVGKAQEHLQVQLRQGSTVMKAIGFGLGKLAPALMDAGSGARLDLAFRPTISRFTGAEVVEAELKDLRFAAS